MSNDENNTPRRAATSNVIDLCVFRREGKLERLELEHAAEPPACVRCAPSKGSVCVCGFYTPPLPTCCPTCKAPVLIAERVRYVLVNARGDMGRLPDDPAARRLAGYFEHLRYTQLRTVVALEGFCIDCMHREVSRRERERRRERREHRASERAQEKARAARRAQRDQARTAEVARA